MRYCGHFLIKVEGGAKNYKRDLPLLLAWYCRQEKSYGGELVTQIFMIIRYLNFSISVLPVV